AGLAGGDRDKGVPVVRHRDDHGIDVFAGEQFLELFVGGATLVFFVLFDAVEFVGDLPVVLAPGGIHIANGQDLGVGLVKEIVQQPSALGACSDEAERDP